MKNLNLNAVDTDILIHRIAERTVELLRRSSNQEPPSEITPDPLDDFIPKSEVRGKLASASTLWKYEKEGKITSYAISGKRFYKRSELAKAFTKLKK